MEAVKRLFNRILGRIPAKGTITTTTGDEDYPVAISNEVMGGPFIVNTLDELMEIPVERLVKGCKCTVNEFTESNVTQPTRTYLLRVVPSEKLSDQVDPNISEYWILDRPQQQFETAVESQYSGNFEGQRPPFLPTDISNEAYQDGYGSTADYESADTSRRIWHSDYNHTTDIWVRQRTGSLAPWGIPVKVNEGYEEGYYSDVRFIWRDVNLGAPARPASTVNGELNNEPDGWQDTPDIPDGEIYENWVLLNSLWSINATKGVYGDLVSEWSNPIQVSTNGDLVRYGIDPYNTDYTNNAYWRPYFTEGDKYRASRTAVGEPWVVEAIAGESGEYIDYVFKEFEDSYEPDETDAPQTTTGYGGATGWRDSVFNSQPGYTLYVSTSRKYSDGSLKTGWTLPVRYDGKNTIRTVIEPYNDSGSATNTSGHIFKYTTNQGTQTVTPSALNLRAVLYEANTPVAPSDFDLVQWYMGDLDTGSLITSRPIGTEPNRNPQFSGDNNCQLEIFPENVTNSQLITVVITFRGETYIDFIELLDVTDGLGVFPVIESTAGYTFRESETKTFTPKLYINGTNSIDSASSYVWHLNGASYENQDSLDVTADQVSGITTLTLEVEYNDLTYMRNEALTDVSDGKSVERQYSPLETIDMNLSPDAPGNPNQWSPSSEDAYWAIERIEDGQWNIPYRVRGEKGTPNGSFQKTVYRTRPANTNPSWLYQRPVSQSATGSVLTPVDWTDVPESNAPTGSEIWATKATFNKNPGTEGVTEIVANWTITGGGWSLPFKLTHFPEAGDNGAPGTDGLNGWTPRLAVVVNGSRRVQQLVEWIGGSGAPPAGTGWYIGPTGLVPDIGSATDIRGAQGPSGATGEDGVFNSDDYWDGDSAYYNPYELNGSTGSPNHHNWFSAWRKNAAGIVFFQGTLKGSAEDRTREVTLGNLPSHMRPEKIAGTQSSADEYTLKFFDDSNSVRSFRINYDTGQVRCHVGGNSRTTTFHGMFYTSTAMQ